jgi:hypothetical protein
MMMGANNNTSSELDLIKKECTEMIATLKQLHEEEIILHKENEVLAQQAILAGSKGGMDGARKRGRSSNKPKSASAAVKKADASKTSGVNGNS